MKEKILLEKEYTLDVETLRSGCAAYQKKYVYPRAYLRIAVFIVIALNFVYGIVTGPVDKGSGLLASLLIVACLALAFREWFNPKKLKRSIVEGFLEMEPKPVYKLVVSEENVEISTLNLPDPDPDSDDMPGEMLPERSQYPRDKHLFTAEYDKFFLLIYAKLIYYIVPKEGFSEDELEVIRKI